MKVFALGGYGKAGFPAIKLLVKSDLVTEIAVAGRNQTRAEKAAAEIGEKAIAVRTDGTDEKKLTSLLAGYDIIINAAAHKAVVPAIRAAARTGTHYCDATASMEVIEQALELTPDAEGVGITAIIGNGVEPCIGNLMGVHVAHQLEEVEQLQGGDAIIFNGQSGMILTPRQWLRDPKESMDALHECRPYIAGILWRAQEKGFRAVLDYQDGRWVEIDPVKCGLDVPLTQASNITTYPYFSGDPIFPYLPSDLSAVSPVAMYFSPFPPQLHDVLHELSLRVFGGEIDSDSAANSFYETIESDPNGLLSLPNDFVAPPEVWLRAVGRKGGRAARCSCWFTAPMWNVDGYFLTGAAIAVAALKMLRGEIRERGVMTAEKAFKPLPFLDEVASLIPELLPDGKLIDESFEWLE